MATIKRLAHFFERNEWVPKTLFPVLAMTFCMCLAYFTAVAFGELPNADAYSHLAALLVMLAVGSPAAVIYKAVKYLDKKDALAN